MYRSSRAGEMMPRIIKTALEVNDECSDNLNWGPAHMGRSYLVYRENIDLALLWNNMKVALRSYETKSFPGTDTEISLVDRRDLGDRDNFCLIWTQFSRLAGKPSVYTLQNLRHSGNLYPASWKTFPHTNRTKLFDLSKCFLIATEITSAHMNRP